MVCFFTLPSTSELWLLLNAFSVWTGLLPQACCFVFTQLWRRWGVQRTPSALSTRHPPRKAFMCVWNAGRPREI